MSHDEPDLDSMTCNEREAFVIAMDRKEKERRLDMAIAKTREGKGGATPLKRWANLCLQYGDAENVVRLHERTEYEIAKEASSRCLADAVANIRTDPRPFEIFADAFWAMPHPDGGTVGEHSWKLHWKGLPWWRKLAWKLWGRRLWDAKMRRQVMRRAAS